MNESKPDPRRLLDEAIDLIIRLQNSPDNPIALEMVAGWRACSDEHERTWTKVSGAHGMSGKILTDRAKAERKAKSKVTRRKFMIGGAAGLGAVTAGSFLAPDAIVSTHADYTTGKGEIRRVALEDSSLVTLGPESALALDYGAEWRGIALLQGMCFFDVHENIRRPFVVEAGRVTATALGTRFDMSLDAGFVNLSVADGRVQTQAFYGGSWADAQLSKGDWMRFDSSRRATFGGRRETGQIAVWREAFLVADREPLAALVARISRWCPGRVLVADPFIGAQEVSGLFDLREPYRALEAVVHPAGGRVRRVTSYLTVVTPF